MYRTIKLAFFIFGATYLSGCAHVSVSNETLPPAKYAGDIRPSGNFLVFKNGELPPRSFIRIGLVSASGNQNASFKNLEEKIIKTSKWIGGDGVIITNKNSTPSGSVGASSGGISISELTYSPSMYGVIFKYSRVDFGVLCDKQGRINYVKENSTAEREGLSEGMKILAINGNPLLSSPYVAEEEIGVKNPGDKIAIEFLDKNTQKIRKEIILEAAK